MLAGTLEVMMRASMAQLSQDMQQATRLVGSATSQMSSMAATAKAALETIGVGLSVGALIEFARRTEDAIGHMKDLGEEAGVTAAQISKFEAPTRIAGSSLDAVAMAMNRMSRAAVQARDPASLSAQAFHAIGISTAEIKNLKPDELFELIARRLDGYSDGVQKNAVMQQLLGRSGRDMNSTMEAIANTTQLVSSVTDEQADKAKALDKAIVALRMSAEAYWRGLALEFIPMLTDLVKELDRTRESSKNLASSWDPFLEVLKTLVALGANVSFVFTTMGKDIARAIENVKLIAKGDFAGSRALGEIFAKDAAQARKDLDDFTARVMALGKAMSNANAAAGGYDDDPSHGDRGAGRPKPNPNFDPAANAGLKAYLAENAALDKQIAALRGVGEMEAYLEKLRTASFDKLSKQQKDDLIAKEATIVKLQNEKVSRDDLIKSETAQIEAEKKLVDLEQSARDTSRDEIAQMQFAITLIGKSAAEVEKLTAQHQADLDLRKQLQQIGEGDDISAEQAAVVNGLIKENDQRKAAIGLMKDQKAAAEEQLSVWRDLADRASQFFGDLVMHGKSAFSSLRDMLKQFLAEMVSLFAKRWILQLGASMMGGGVSGGALASQAQSTGAGTLAGAAMNGLTSYGMSSLGLGSLISGAGTGLAGAFGTGVLTGAGDFVGTGLAGMAGNVALAAGATDAFAATVAAAVPVIGWIVAIGALLYSIFGSKGGGTKTQGAFLGMFSGHGDFLSALPNAENVLDIHGTQDASNAQAQQMGIQIAQGLVQGIAALGGNGSAFQLGSAFSMDPAGNAPSFFHGILRNGQGQEVFRYFNDQMSRDPQQFQQEVQAALSRMLVGALQNDTTLPAAIQRWVHTIDATSASDTDIQRILKGAAAIKSLYGEIDSLNATLAELADPTGVTAVTDALAALDKSVVDAKKALDDAQAAGDPTQFLTAEQAYKQAVVSRYQQEIAMVQQLQQALRQAEDAAYQFAFNIAQRINAVGGSADIAGLAMGRASELQSRIGPQNALSRSGSEPIASQIQDLQGYVGAIDQWYQARHDAILADAQREADAINAQNHAQAALWQERAAQLQKELDAVKALAAVVANAATLSKDMELSTANPLAATGRLDLARGNVDQLRAAFQSATGTDRATIGQQLVDALKTEQSMAASTFDRPSNAYASIYNQIQSDLGLVQSAGPSLQQQQVDLTQRIADAQATANDYASRTADATTIAREQLAALDAEARGYYTWAQTQGAALYALQHQYLAAQLNAITGGQDPQLWIAQKSTEMRDLLKKLVDQNQAFLDAIGGGKNPAAGGGNAIAGGPGGGGSSGMDKIVIIHSQDTPETIIRKIQAGGAQARRTLGMT